MEAGWLKGYDCIKQSGTDLFDAGNIGIDHHGVVGIVDHKSRFGSARFFDILLFLLVSGMIYLYSRLFRLLFSFFMHRHFD